MNSVRINDVSLWCKKANKQEITWAEVDDVEIRGEPTDDDDEIDDEEVDGGPLVDDVDDCPKWWWAEACDGLVGVGAYNLVEL